jgi:hypothetical protein
MVDDLRRIAKLSRVNVMGTESGTRLKVEWKSISAPGRSLMSVRRRTTSSSAMRRFIRARLEPTLRCGPAPKVMCRLRSRPRSNVSGFSNSAASRLAEAPT